MIVNSHLLIANYTAAHVKETTGFTLNKSKFRYGNIKPDIEATFLKYDHDFGGTINIVKDLINKLIYEDFDNKTFSETLGVVNHFLSDYFCSYHSFYNLKKRNIFIHLTYETLLHYRLRHKLFMKKKLKPLIIMDINGNSIDELIRGLRNEYFNNKRSMSNDIRFALSATSMISTFVIMEKLAQEQINERIAA